MNNSSETYLMNPKTGSVDTKENWESEGFTQNNSDLIEVVKKQNEWVDCKGMNQ